MAVIPQIPPETVNADTEWAFLQEGLHQIMTGPQISYRRYMELHNRIFAFCTTPKMTRGEDNIEMFLNECSDYLYEKLAGFFAAHLNTLKIASEPLQDEALLQYYAKKWEHYTEKANYIERLFNYFNRHWVTRMRCEGRKDVYSVYTLALVQWRNEFFPHPQRKDSKLVGSILRVIDRHRSGEEIDEGAVKEVVRSLVTLGLDETSDVQTVLLGLYEEHFEIPFLDATDRYYKLESGGFLSNNRVSNYPKKVEEWLGEEEDRVGKYLNESTKGQLISRCEHVLIKEHSELIQESFHDVPDEDLQRMRALLARVSIG